MSVAADKGACMLSTGMEYIFVDAAAVACMAVDTHAQAVAITISPVVGIRSKAAVGQFCPIAVIAGIANGRQ